MKPVHTPFTNIVLGANQDEYLSLPFHPLIVSTEPPYDQPEDKDQPEEYERPD